MGVKPQLFGNKQPHLFTYYTTNGYDADGDNLGAYNHEYDGWVQFDANVFPGAQINGVSTFGGVQYVITIKFQLWQGNWWFQCQGVWLGYYPATLFPGKTATTTLGDHGSWVGFWGEVYSSPEDPAQTTTHMGSGKFAKAGWGQSAFQRNIVVQSSRQGALVDSNGFPSVEGPTYYDIEIHLKSGSPWGSYFWFGGPGRLRRSLFVPLTPSEVVQIMIGGPAGSLISIDAKGHIKIVPMPNPEP